MKNHPMLTLFVAVFCGISQTNAVAGHASTAAQAVVTADAFGAERPQPRLATMIVRPETWIMPASPEAIFPLLCPTREYDWIPTWRARMIHSKSGMAEENCIFETRFPLYGPMTWMCTRYEPPTQIEYTSFAERGFVVRLTIKLEGIAGGTRMHWSRAWFATSASGEESLKQWDEAVYTKSMIRLREELEHYLKTGTTLPVGN